MRTARAGPSSQAALAYALQQSILDVWYKKPDAHTEPPPPPFSEEQYQRMIDIVEQHQSDRRHLSPEACLRDWLDAEEEVRTH